MGVLLTDSELNYYGDVFLHLNTQYELVSKHQFRFTDFIACVDNEQFIHLYFANQHLFVNRRNSATIKLKTFLIDPNAFLEASLNVDHAYREADGVRCAQPIFSQIVMATWLDIEWITEFLEKETQKKHNNTVLSDQKLIERFAHYYYPKRKQCKEKHYG